MSTTNSTVIKEDVKRVANKAAFSPVMEALTRIGYGVRGLIYITIGLLALGVALGKGGSLTNQQGAIAAIGAQPAGIVLLWVILIGLVSYTLWGVIRAVMDPLHKGHDLKGLIIRGGFLLSAASYALLIPSTYGFISGAGSSASNGAQTQQSLSAILATPAGKIVLVLIGLVVIAGGVVQILAGVNSKFDQQFKTYTMNAREVRWATQLGRFGTVIRGLILALIGVLVCLAAFQSNSSQGIGIDSVLTALMRQPYGSWILGIVAVGLMAFGAYSVLGAVWFRLKR